MQHAPQRRHSGQSQKNGPYDTDAESIDTTANQSVVQVDDSQARASHYQQQGGTFDLGGATDDEEEVSQYDEEGEEAESVDSDFVLTQEHSEFLQKRGQTHLSRPEAIEYLRLNLVPVFPVVEGDSYPATTDGHLSELQEGQEQLFEVFDDGGPMTPSPRHPRASSRRTQATASVHTEVVDPTNGQAARGQTKLFKQSANIRGQQRLNANSQQVGQDFPSSTVQVMPVPTHFHSQPNREIAPAQGTNLYKRPDQHVTFSQSQQPNVHQSSNTIHVTRQSVNPTAAPVAKKRRPSGHTASIPMIQQQRAEQPMIHGPAHDSNFDPDGDYDVKTLHAMRYDELRDESFDINPRLSDPPLSGEMLNKPLVERLAHVQEKFDAGKQSDFFRALPTAEWEDAGDWFLDQFSSIIKRTKEARQEKRKLAQGFEKEIEKRHKLVSKKQQHVASAMNKMQAQGQGLVPRSPRPSKSPRPKKR
jgi:hypothetical protein